MNDLISEPMGFKYTVVGFSAWFVSLLNNVDITQIIGFIGLIIGLAIQVASWLRNKQRDKIQDEVDKRAIEADERDKIQYNLQMQVLSKQLADIEKG